MTGYKRQDTTNKIANGEVIDADIFDAEFNALAAAFNQTDGHNHDGTSTGGASITNVGPAQDIVVTATVMRPKTDNVVDLGTPILEYKDLFIDGTASIDTLQVDENATIAGTLDATGATTLSATLDVTGNTTVGGTLDVTGLLTASGGVTGDVTGNITGDVTGTVSSISNHTTDVLTEGATNLYFTNTRAADAISVMDAGGDGSLTKSGGTITYTGPSATETRAHFSAANSGTGYGSIAYSNGVYTYTKVTDTNIRGSLSASTSTGINYNSTTGVISGVDATTISKGVAYFSPTDFSVVSGGVSLNDEAIQDIVGAMVSGNTESNISVLYDDTDGTLDFIINSNPSLQNLDVLNDTTLKNVYVSDLVRTPYVYTSGLELTLGANSVVEAKVTSAGVNIYNGLVVGNSTTTPTDNDIYATGTVEAAQGYKVGSWTITETSGGSLLFSDGTNLLMKLYPSTGNLQIAGTLSQNVSISPV